MKNKDSKKSTKKALKQEEEAKEILKKSKEPKGMQLRIELEKGNLTEVNEIREILGRQIEDPDEKYNLYYKGITSLLKKYLPKDKSFKEYRQLIYDEKNIFLNRGKKKSDNDGIRKSDGKMTFQPIMSELLDVITKWVSESLIPMNLYDMLYDLNEKNGYGHENYDPTTIKYQLARDLESKNTNAQPNLFNGESLHH